MISKFTLLDLALVAFFLWAFPGPRAAGILLAVAILVRVARDAWPKQDKALFSDDPWSWKRKR